MQTGSPVYRAAFFLFRQRVVNMATSPRSQTPLPSVNQPSPAIVTQGAVRRLPRVTLLLLCIAYVLPGFFGRTPWKGPDISGFAYMAELARGGANWLAPQLLGRSPEVDALLPYWLGAWAMQLAPGWVAGDFAARVPFGLLLAVTLCATWYGTYYLARSPGAQPVAFAFGGEALPPDYARAVADGGLLAFIACLGLAQLSHETTPALAQLTFSTLSFYAFAALPYRTLWPAICAALGLAGLALSGAPSVAVLSGAGGALIHWFDHNPGRKPVTHKLRWVGAMALLTLLVALLSSQLALWRWRIELPQASWAEWRSLGRLLLWFTWPAWPLVIWTLWRWRHQLVQHGALSRHLALPLWFAVIAVGATLTTASADRSLLLALPALATLAAFALPTLKRSVAALIDWFTLLFFSGCGLIIWVIWIAIQTGVPKQPAANVARLAPGFEPHFSLLPFVIAVAATLAWIWLVKWRAGRHRAAIWKSLVLPAGGAAWCWVLLMTLWLPLLDFARSYAQLVNATLVVVAPASCVEVDGLSPGQIAAFQWHGHLTVKATGARAGCPWLLVNKDGAPTLAASVDSAQWTLYASVRHAVDRDEYVQIYQRATSAPR